MAARLRIELRADWRASGDSSSRNALVYCIAPGESQIDWQTEKVRAVADLKKLLEAINSAGGLTLLMETHYASMLFPNHRDVDLVSIQFKEWNPSGGDGVLLTSSCKDLKVSKVMPLTAHLVELAKGKGITLDIDADKSQVVTLRTKQKFSTS